MSEIIGEEYGRSIIQIEGKGRYMNYGKPIIVGGALLEAWQPADSDAKRELILRVYNGDALVREEATPMFYPNTFGIDIADSDTFDTMVERVIKDLGLE